MTARGRLAAVLVLVLLLLAAFSLGRTVAEGSTQAAPAAPPSVEEVVVQPGDTLWAIAQRVAPGQDPRPVIDRIRELNALPGAELKAGQQLLLPVAR